MANNIIHLVAASHIEARPVITHYQLHRLGAAKLFEIFINKEETIAITISGIGKLSAAAAVVYSSQVVPNETNRCWLNVGIAGHKTLPVNTPVLANKIFDGGNHVSWFPQIIFDHTLEECSLLTVDKPSDTYPHNQIVDMEASGFYSSAVRLETCELVHCLKIISDNEEHHFSNLNKNTIENHLLDNLDAIDEVIGKLQNVLLELPPQSYDQKILEQLTSWHHYTHSEKLQLIAALKRWGHLLPDKPLEVNTIRSLKKSRQVLNYLAETMNNAPIHF